MPWTDITRRDYAREAARYAIGGLEKPPHLDRFVIHIKGTGD